MATEITIYSQDGKKTGTIKPPAQLFDVAENGALVHQVFTAKLANRRRNYAHAKTRAQVRGGGRKPWRQKGTGRARHGSIRSPLWVGGGVTFGPSNERVFSKKVNKKMNRKALAVVLSAKAREGSIAVVDSLKYKEPKTKLGANMLRAIDVAGQSVIVFGAGEDSGFDKVFRNIPKVTAANIQSIDIVGLLNNKFCIFSKDAYETLVARYSQESKSTEPMKDTAKNKETTPAA